MKWIILLWRFGNDILVRWMKVDDFARFFNVNKGCSWYAFTALYAVLLKRLDLADK